MFFMFIVPDNPHPRHLMSSLLKSYGNALHILSPFFTFCLRQYIAYARQFDPTLPPELVEYITGAYISLRSSDMLGKDFYTTPRTLTAIIRMSQALARLRFSVVVAKADVDEAMRLLDSSRASVLLPSNNAKTNAVDPITRIYSLIREMPSSEEEGSSGCKEISIDALRDRVRISGFNESQLFDTIKMFEGTGMWKLSSDERRLIILN